MINDASIICLSPANQLLLTLISYWLLSLIFEISVSSVSRVINRTWPILWEKLSPDVKWSSPQQWNSLRGLWQEMPDVVAVIDIDGTSHEIHRPQGQEEYYSGHRHIHCFHTIVILPANKEFRLVYMYICWQTLAIHARTQSPYRQSERHQQVDDQQCIP